MPDRRDDSHDVRAVWRERVLELLYEADTKGEAPADLLRGDEPAFIRERIRGLTERRSEIDAQLTAHVIGWQLERLAPIDRAILRLATAELLEASTPPSVAIAEAVKLADRYSTERSAAFVNGVLASIAVDIAGEGHRGEPDREPS
ncbi:NusB antitermination factor [Acidimicrobium ferrooxidans DSM 10331]|uniref:Transcription antitermination protein NusB n=1 Tax=Acidimicrobium ferrooxidans (strain DSM 10331 / JCM 15462 / NBRC 103882 / ICP) TaxID=525909 RepID=C7M0X2_ACIFD|nr:transcription antitermination factor NusB [Acidimicrobium ferrooxidans]ACU54630.1 NusB antitermination factor [Acidimicrobium ferrooxidans DSM 10331]